MTDTVSRRTEPDTESGTSASQEQVVVCVAMIRLQQIVIDVLDRYFGTYPVDTHGFELEHDQCTGRVLRQRLVDAQRNLLVSPHRTGNAVGGEELLSHVHGTAILRTEPLHWFS
jgi:hypothetical protein